MVDSDPQTAGQSTQSIPVRAGGQRPMRIGLIAPPMVAVPPPNYGGTEMVIDLLARGLTARGHQVVLYTVGDSTCPVELRWKHPEALSTEAGLFAEVVHARDGYRALRDVDLIHDHTTSGPLLPPGSFPQLPILATLHSLLEPELRNSLTRTVGRIGLIAISHDQRRSAPEIPMRTVIHHGIDASMYPFGNGDGGYLLFLGRIAPVKGVHHAINVARATGRRLLIAAKMWESEERRYFAEVIEPMLGPGIEYLGPVGPERKRELLAGAEALINPIRWREPFGLVMIEALACGTPVIAFPEGAAPEIIENGVTGFLCTDEADMAAALERVATLDRAVCRRACLRLFSVNRMVNRHVRAYADAIERFHSTDTLSERSGEAG
ncbi:MULTISPECIES: glycosyltransferase family 4 protein [unclassified Diaminobutyricimonas]|uniref:glycosyltransferase family 4 protein n=1 Tax=unclassified Diaminobutyricimonas TaxID=2643261 RepID=UPI0018DFD39C|nr:MULTISPECIES: glycosyltransferase family 4 protein [unclassified Diaminobutyricimonas]